jgi:hypothetical protein
MVRERRLDLQEYLRALLKVGVVLERSYALQHFLEINKTKLNSGGRIGELTAAVEASGRHDSDDQSLAESVEGGRRSIFDQEKCITVPADPHYDDNSYHYHHHDNRCFERAGG